MNYKEMITIGDYGIKEVVRTCQRIPGIRAAIFLPSLAARKKYEESIRDCVACIYNIAKVEDVPYLLAGENCGRQFILPNGSRIYCQMLFSPESIHFLNVNLIASTHEVLSRIHNYGETKILFPLSAVDRPPFDMVEFEKILDPK